MKKIQVMHFKSPSEGKISNWMLSIRSINRILYPRQHFPKYIYLCIIGIHITNEEKFYKVFPNAERISETIFDMFYDNGNGSQIITVADADVINEMFPDGNKEHTHSLK